MQTTAGLKTHTIFSDLIFYEDLIIDRNVAPNVKDAIDKVCTAIAAPLPAFIGTVVNYGDTANACATTMYGKPALLVTPGLTKDPEDSIEGTIAHEMGHIVEGHLADDERMLFLRRKDPEGFRKASHKVEYEADKFAAEHGFGAGLAKAVENYGGRESADHPGWEERVKRIRAAMPKVRAA